MLVQDIVDAYEKAAAVAENDAQRKALTALRDELMALRELLKSVQS